MFLQDAHVDQAAVIRLDGHGHMIVVRQENLTRVGHLRRVDGRKLAERFKRLKEGLGEIGGVNHSEVV
jgi:hypothetical protein